MPAIKMILGEKELVLPGDFNEKIVIVKFKLQLI